MKKIMVLVLLGIVAVGLLYCFSGLFEDTRCFPTATKITDEHERNSLFDDHAMLKIEEINLDNSGYNTLLQQINEDFSVSIYGVNESVDTVYQWYKYEYEKNGWNLNRTHTFSYESTVVNAFFYMKGLSGELLVLGTGDLVQDNLNKQSGIIILKAPLWTFNEYKEKYL